MTLSLLSRVPAVQGLSIHLARLQTHFGAVYSVPDVTSFLQPLLSSSQSLFDVEEWSLAKQTQWTVNNHRAQTAGSQEGEGDGGKAQKEERGKEVEKKAKNHKEDLTKAG